MPEDWRIYKIKDVLFESKYDYFRMFLDHQIEFKDGYKWSVFTTKNFYPFNTWKAGDYIEIEVDFVKNNYSGRSLPRFIECEVLGLFPKIRKSEHSSDATPASPRLAVLSGEDIFTSAIPWEVRELEDEIQSGVLEYKVEESKSDGHYRQETWIVDKSNSNTWVRKN